MPISSYRERRVVCQTRRGGPPGVTSTSIPAQYQYTHNKSIVSTTVIILILGTNQVECVYQPQIVLLISLL